MARKLRHSVPPIPPDIKPRRIKEDSRTYNRMKMEEALSYCPPIKPCRDCGAPVIDGFRCWRCKSYNP